LIVPTLTDNYQDSGPQYKSGLATALCEMSKNCDKDYCQLKLLPTLTLLLNDDNSDVGKNVVIGLFNVYQVVGIDMLTANLLETLDKMTKDSQWRVRDAVFDLLAKITLEFDDAKQFMKIKHIFMQFLTNNAASVRETGVKWVAKIAEKFDEGFISDFFLPEFYEKAEKKDGSPFNIRMTALAAMAACIPHVSKETVEAQIVPFLVKAVEDKVPNVAFYACKLIRDQAKNLDPRVLTDIKTKVKKLLNDNEITDRDVIYFAIQVVKA